MPHPEIYNEKVLLQKIADGDTTAFAVLFHGYNARLFPFVKKIVKSDVIAEEIVQEVFLRVWVHRERPVEMDNPGAWIFRIASNLSMTHLRNAANEAFKLGAAVQPEDAAIDTLTQQIDARNLSALLEQAVRRLPAKRQQIYRLSRQEGLNHKEIAQKLSLSTHTIKDHLVLALKFIREYIQHHTGESLTAFTLITLL